jgi:SAM-dependent methyltransferase
MRNDPWLKKWMDMLWEKSAGGYILELGCGSGWDTEDLLSAGCRVVATDIGRENVTGCAQRLPRAMVAQIDIGRPLPFADRRFPVILASLSLHYFSWTNTLQIEAELRRCLQPNGILLARFNSIHDYYHGASSETEIETNFYLVNGRTKRFFGEDHVRSFLQGWDIRFLEENVIQRYKNPKYVWEAVAVCK